MNRENLKFWVPVVLGILITPVFFLASSWSGSGAASHAGGGFQILFFYPIPVGLAILLSGGQPAPTVKMLCIVIAALQFPFFGYLIGFPRTNKSGILFTVVLLLVWLHVIMSAISLAIIGIAAFWGK